MGGDVTNKAKTICGVGINDSNYSVVEHDIRGGVSKITWICPFYNTWKGMMGRCYNDKWQSARPAYIGCSVDPAWHSFMAFRAWMMIQSWEGNQLDKDILFPGNKIYSKEACVFVPQRLNGFLTDCSASRGEWPIGVSWNKHAVKFSAVCRNPFTGKRDHLGYFDSPSKAHESWRSKKHEHACRYADMQTDQRIASALRTRYSGPQISPE